MFEQKEAGRHASTSGAQARPAPTKLNRRGEALGSPRANLKIHPYEDKKIKPHKEEQ